MDFKQIEQFIAIINSGSFSRAAENLYMSQPSLSKQIKSLEIELGVDLFDRTTKGASLTEAGELFLAFAQKVRKEQNKFIDSLGVCTESTVSTIRLGALPIVALPTYRFSSLIANFQESHFQYTVEYIETDQHNLISMLKSNRIELAIGRPGDENDKDLDILPLLTDELVAVVSKDHALATKKVVALEELSREKFILLGYQSALNAQCINAFKAINLSPKIIHTNTRHKIVLEMVSKNIGISILPKNMVDSNPQLKTLKLKHPIYSTVAMVRMKSKECSPPGLLFWEYVKENYPVSLAAKLN